jgi:hypothetical protein
MKKKTVPKNALVPASESGIVTGLRPLRVRSIKSSLRLLGRVLFLAQKKEIDPMLARLLIYGVQVYSGVVRDCGFEERLSAIEAALRTKKT